MTKPSAVVGVALSPLELCAVRAEERSSAVWRTPLEPMTEPSSWPSLAAALRALSQQQRGAGVLSIALMPPLAEVRAIDLPALREEELRTLLTRQVSRYFVGVRGAQLVSASPPPGGRDGARPTVAAAAAQRLIAAIHQAAREAGWSVADIAPAESAWAAASAAMWPAFAKSESVVLVARRDRTDMLTVNGGALINVRRFRDGEADVAQLRDAIAPADRSRVAIVGTEDDQRELARALSAGGVNVSAVPVAFTAAAWQPDRLAAAFAPKATSLLLRTDEVRETIDGAARRLATTIAVAAAAIVMVAAGVELWGVKRELRVVQAERAALSPQLSTTLVGRTTVETAYRQLATLNVAERGATHWSGLLADLSGHLNADAYLTAFRARGDSVVVDGLAAHAARVFDDLAQTPGLDGVRAAAPVRREAPNGGEATERFTIAARVTAPGNARPVSQTGGR